MHIAEAKKIFERRRSHFSKVSPGGAVIVGMYSRYRDGKFPGGSCRQQLKKATITGFFSLKYFLTADKY
jgi:hypothetical protein